MGAGILSGGNNLNIVSMGDVIFNGNVSLGGASIATGNVHSGGNVQLGNDAIVQGSVFAAGTVTLGGSATVQQNVNSGAAAGVAINLGNNANILGTATHNPGTTISFGGGATVGADVTGIPAAPTPYITTVIPTATAISTDGAPDFNLGGSSILTLPQAGGPTYGDIVLGNTSVLNVSAGAYFFDRWNLGGGTTINFDVTGGDIQLYFTGATGATVLGNNVMVNVIGGDAGDIYMETLGNFQAGGGTNWKGTIFASGAASDINFGNTSVITGALWARDLLEINGGSQLNFTLADFVTGPSGTPIPEPGTSALLAAGLLGIFGRRRFRAYS